MGKMATSPLPYRGSPPLQSGGAKSEVAHKWAKWLPHPCRIGDPHRFRAGGQNQKWPTSGQSGYLTPAVSGIPTASERGAKSEVAHKWAMAHKWAKWLRHPCRLGDPHRFRAGGQNQKWPTSEQSGYLTPAVSGIPTASERGAKSEVAHKWAMAHKWAKCLRHPCRLGDPHRFRAGGQNQKWPTSEQSGYLTPAVSGIPTASERGAKSEVAHKWAMAHKWARWLPHPCRIGDPHRFRAGGAKSEVAHKWAKWLPHPCRIGDPHRFRAGGKIRSGPQVGKVATSTLPYRGSPPLQSGGAKSEVAHKWAKWLPHPCRIGDPHRFRAGGKIRSGPQVGKMGTSALPYRGSPPLQSGRGKIRSGPQVGKVATSPLLYRGSPPLQSGGAKSEVAHKWAKWLPHPCRIGDPHRFRAGGGKIRSGPQVGKMATSPLPYRGSPPLQSGGAKSEVAHKWAKWLPHPCRIGDPHRFRAGGQNQKWPTSGQNGYLTPAVSGIPTASERGGKIRSGPEVGKMATSPLPYRGSPPLQSGGQNQKWPTSGQNGYLTPAVSGIPTASERGGKIRSGPQVGKMATSPLPYRGSPPLQSGGAKSEVAHKWAKWLPHPCRIGDPHHFRAGGKIRSGPQVGKMATSPLPYRGSPPLQSGGAKSEVAHKWAKWLPHPCRIGDPHRFRAGGKIRSGPQVGNGPQVGCPLVGHF